MAGAWNCPTDGNRPRGQSRLMTRELARRLFEQRRMDGAVVAPEPHQGPLPIAERLARLYPRRRIDDGAWHGPMLGNGATERGQFIERHQAGPQPRSAETCWSQATSG